MRNITLMIKLLTIIMMSIVTTSCAFGQATNICGSMNGTLVAQFYKVPQQNCPQGTTLFQGFCQVEATVTGCHGNGFGSYQGTLVDRLTREAFNYDVCKHYTGETGLWCNLEEVTIDLLADYAEYCTNIAGSWVNNYGESFFFTQEQGDQTVEGAGFLRNSSNGQGCGTSAVSGLNTGESVNLTFEATVNCPAPTNYTLTNNCSTLSGTWSAAGNSGSVTLTR